MSAIQTQGGRPPPHQPATVVGNAKSPLAQRDLSVNRQASRRPQPHSLGMHRQASDLFAAGATKVVPPANQRAYQEAHVQPSAAGRLWNTIKHYPQRKAERLEAQREIKASEEFESVCKEVGTQTRVLMTPNAGGRLISMAVDTLPLTTARMDQPAAARMKAFGAAVDHELKGHTLSQLHDLKHNIAQFRGFDTQQLTQHRFGKPVPRENAELALLESKVSAAINDLEAAGAAIVSVVAQPTPSNAGRVAPGQTAMEKLGALRQTANEGVARHVKDAALTLIQCGEHDRDGKKLTHALRMLEMASAHMDVLITVNLHGRPQGIEDVMAQKEDLLKRALDGAGLSRDQREKLKTVLGGRLVQDLNMVLNDLQRELVTTGRPGLEKLGRHLGGLEQVIGRFAAAADGALGEHAAGDPSSVRFAPVYKAIAATFKVEVGVTMSENGAPQFVPIGSNANFYAPRDSTSMFASDDARMHEGLRISARGDKNLANFHVLDALDQHQAGRFHTVWGARRFMKQLQKEATFMSDVAEISKPRDLAIANAMHKLNSVNSRAEAKKALDQLRTHIQDAVFENSKGRFLRVNGIPV